MKRTTLLLLFFCFLFPFFLKGQTGSRLVHYSVEDGLPHNRIGSIFQDSRGFMWLTTLNGVARFDGYEFIPYLNGSSDSYRVRNSRITRIAEDRNGYMWFITYVGEVHRLDPSTNELCNVGNLLEGPHSSFHASRLKIVSSGAVWLISEKDGCVRITDPSLAFTKYSVENGGLKGSAISYIHEDKQGNSWILTDNGIARVCPGETTPEFFFEGNTTNRQRFYSVLEWNDEVWFGTDKGRIWQYKKGTNQFELFETGVSSEINHLIPGKSGQAVIGTKNDGLFIYDWESGSCTRYSTANSGLVNNRIRSLWLDPYDNVWIHVNAPGIARLDARSNRIMHYESEPLDGNEHLSSGAFLRVDSEKRVWVRLRDGLFSLYDPQTKTLTPFHETPYAPSADYPSTIISAYFDRQGNLWVCSSLKGLDKITFSKNSFHARKVSAGAGVGDNDVRALFEDGNGNLWVSTKEAKIHVYTGNEEYRGYLCADGTIGYGESIRGVAYCIHEDRAGQIWIGTKGEGLYCLTPDGNRYRIRRYRNDPRNIYSLNDNNIYSIRGDSKGRIWIGTWGGGLNVMDFHGRDSVRFLNHHNELVHYPMDQTAFVRYISEEKDGKLYAGTSMGLLVFKTDWTSPQEVLFRHYDQNDAQNTMVSSDIHDICHTRSGTYIATGGGGLSVVVGWDEKGFPAHFKTYTRKDGLPSDNLLSIVQAHNRSLWICCEENITQFDPVTETFRNFDETGELLRAGLFSEGSALLSRTTGKLMLGYFRGIIEFRPDDVQPSSFVPPIVFTHFRLFNEDVPVGEHSVLSRHINEQERIVLGHKDKNFNVEFAALDFNASEKIKYAYKLEGFDPDWNYADKQRVAGYMNLPRGEYRLRVKSTNADGTWVDNERQLLIVMRPSFWETGWAYVLYVFLILLITVTGAYILHTIFRLKNQVRLESELAEMKLNFFTDISHEIRTPLTMITAPVEHLIDDKETPEPVRRQLGLVAQNTRRMLRMINQVLDLRKAQNAPLRVESFGLGDFVASVCRNFEPLAERQGIGFTVEDTTGGESVWADRDAVEKMVFNLISNAFKYTPSGKRIEVRVVWKDGNFRIEVRDEGKGIEPDKLSRIFDRFFTVDAVGRKDSSGIGLSMVKELTDKHHGEIRVESIPGQGSCFTVILPGGCAHFGAIKDSELLADHSPAPENNAPTEINGPERECAAETTAPSRPVVLVTEDDPDLRAFLETILVSDFEVLTAENGLRGVETAMMKIPDLVVSDIMMPGLDGIGLLKELKTNLNTSHIPVILLTAKGSIENKLEGLEFGADDYIVKPFSVPYFRARIRNLLDQRKRLQNLYCSNLVLQEKESPENAILPVDKEFLDQIMRDIKEHLDDSGYSIETLARSSGISRSAFFKKIKALTGMAPVELIRETRLQHAAGLLKTKQLMVKEVAYMVGFNDLKYFTNCFKTRYGQTPSQYRGETASGTGSRL